MMNPSLSLSFHSVSNLSKEIFLILFPKSSSFLDLSCQRKCKQIIFLRETGRGKEKTFSSTKFFSAFIMAELFSPPWIRSPSKIDFLKRGASWFTQNSKKIPLLHFSLLPPLLEKSWKNSFTSQLKTQLQDVTQCVLVRSIFSHSQNGYVGGYGMYIRTYVRTYVHTSERNKLSPQCFPQLLKG